MSNPVLNRVEGQLQELNQVGRTPNGYPAMPGYQAGVGAAGAAQTAQTQQRGGYQQEYPQSYPQDYQQDYQPGGPVSTSLPMTIDDVLTRTGLLFVIVVAVAAVAWRVGANAPGLAMGMLAVGAIGGMILAFVNIFKRRPSPVLISLYAAFEGLAIGSISMVFERYYPGIVIQAVLGTFAIFTVTLLLFRSGKVRATPAMSRFLLIGLLGVIGFGLLSFIANITGLASGSFYNMEIMGIPLGIFVGIFAVFLGALSLIQDFTIAQEAVRAGAPKEVSWQCAFGLIVTLVWLYLEILRLLSYLQRD